MQKNKIVSIIILLVILLGGYWLFLKDDTSVVVESEAIAQGAEEGEIVVNGEVICLPYHINVSGQECVKGIRGQDNVYALDSLAVGGIEQGMEEGTKVTAIGVFTPAVSDKEANVFDYSGVLKLRVLEVRK